MKPQTAPITLSEQDLDRLIEMAWEDRTPFEAIQSQFGLSESAVITIMRQQLTSNGWRRWRARVQGRATKHAVLSAVTGARFKSDQQRQVTHNKISKR